MKICGIICEYNPFHNGHLYHLQAARETSGADFVLCIMSGNFVQRGEAAVLNKYTRARHAVRAGADAVVAEGCESGGHIGESTTMTLVPQVADAVSIPVIAAGGIADGRGFAAARMLGAQAVQVGTRFVVSKECVVHPRYKQQILRAKDIDSVVTGRSGGHPVRALRNKMSREYLRREQAGCEFEELESLTVGALRKAVVDGDVDYGTLMAGQIAGMIQEEKSCREIIEGMMDEAESLMNRAW